MYSNKCSIKTFIDVHAHAHRHTRTHAHAHTQRHTHARTCTHKQNTYAHIHKHTDRQTHTHTLHIFIIALGYTAVKAGGLNSAVCEVSPVSIVSYKQPSSFLWETGDAIREYIRHGSPVFNSSHYPFVVPPRVNLWMQWLHKLCTKVYHIIHTYSKLRKSMYI